MFSLWINNHIVNISIISNAFFVFVLIIFPELDISFSELFFVKLLGFAYRDNFLVEQTYKILPLLTKLFLLICIVFLMFNFFKYRNIKKVISSGAFFLLISAVLSPGFIVNEVFKENFGRARPHQITKFNGKQNFTRAFEISKQCKHNCSFSSGHAAMGYFFSAAAYTAKALYFNKIYIAGVMFGSTVGFSRILMGAHFLSDVVVSAFIVLFFNHITFILWQRLLKNLKK